MKPIELWHGDCLELMERIPEKTVDLVFCDVPYAHQKKSKSVRRCTANSWDLPINLQALWHKLLRIASPLCVFIFTSIQPFTTYLINLQPSLFRYDLVWEKGRPTGILSAKLRPLRAHETLLVFYKKQPVYQPQMMPGGRVFREQKATVNTSNYGRSLPRHQASNSTGLNYPRSVMFYPCVNNRHCIHPTQKPLALMQWIIKTYTKENATILDPTAGSMTSAVAAHQTGRRAICIEKDETYYRRGVDRVRKAMAKPRQAEMAL